MWSHGKGWEGEAERVCQPIMEVEPSWGSQSFPEEVVVALELEQGGTRLAERLERRVGERESQR